MEAINLVTFQAIPNIASIEGRFGPDVALAFHLLSDVVFPLAPIVLRVLGEMFVKDDDCEVHDWLQDFEMLTLTYHCFDLSSFLSPMSPDDRQRWR